MIKVLELFSGYGSQALALKRLGLEYESCISEIDKYAIQAYNLIHGETFNYGDICQIDEKKLPYFDLITYSSPCQDFSIAGKQWGGGKGSGTRSSLLWECERIIRAVRPKYLLMENVKNLVGIKFKPCFCAWLKTLESMGYSNFWQVLNAKDYGVPQNRERVFVVSVLNGGQYLFPQKKELKRKLKDILEKDVDEKYFLSAEQSDNVLKWFKQKDVSNALRIGGASSMDKKHCFDLVQIGNIRQSDSFDNPTRGRVYSAAGISPCLNTMQGGQSQPYVGFDGVRIRKLTPRECWRLMGVDDADFDKVQGKISNTQLYKLAGNSIVVDVLADIFRNIFLNKEEKGQLTLL